jgi:hypothetical protein
MTVHTKWEILVKKLLKLVKLFKSYGLFGEPKVVDFLLFFFSKNVKKKDIFGPKYSFFTTSYVIMLSSIVLYPPYTSKRDIIHTCRCYMKKMSQNLKL